jgi:hypothetical protein
MRRGRAWAQVEEADRQLAASTLEPLSRSPPPGSGSDSGSDVVDVGQPPASPPASGQERVARAPPEWDGRLAALQARLPLPASVRPH